MASGAQLLFRASGRAYHQTQPKYLVEPNPMLANTAPNAVEPNPRRIKPNGYTALHFSLCAC